MQSGDTQDAQPTLNDRLEAYPTLNDRLEACPTSYDRQDAYPTISDRQDAYPTVFRIGSPGFVPAFARSRADDHRQSSGRSAKPAFTGLLSM
jgi:hypothetical protein